MKSQYLPLDEKRIEELLSDQLKGPDVSYCPGLPLVAALLEESKDPKIAIEAGQHLQSCATCRESLALLKEIESVSATSSNSSRQGQGLGLFGMRWAWVGACALIGFISIIWLALYPRGPAQDSVRFLRKGPKDTMSIAVQREDRLFVTSERKDLMEGDRLGFFYSAQSDGYMALFNVTADGTVTLLYPVGKKMMAPIRKGEHQVLPDSGIYRRSEACEWFVGLFADQELGLDDAKIRIEKALKKADFKHCSLEMDLDNLRSVWTFSVR
jgi:hypothetical protein